MDKSGAADVFGIKMPINICLRIAVGKAENDFSLTAVKLFRDEDGTPLFRINEGHRNKVAGRQTAGQKRRKRDIV